MNKAVDGYTYFNGGGEITEISGTGKDLSRKKEIEVIIASCQKD